MHVEKMPAFMLLGQHLCLGDDFALNCSKLEKRQTQNHELFQYHHQPIIFVISYFEGTNDDG